MEPPQLGQFTADMLDENLAWVRRVSCCNATNATSESAPSRPQRASAETSRGDDAASIECSEFVIYTTTSRRGERGTAAPLIESKHHQPAPASTLFRYRRGLQSSRADFNVHAPIRLQTGNQFWGALLAHALVGSRDGV
jgi:hypothetical protein